MVCSFPFTADCHPSPSDFVSVPFSFDSSARQLQMSRSDLRRFCAINKMENEKQLKFWRTSQSRCRISSSDSRRRRGTQPQHQLQQTLKEKDNVPCATETTEGHNAMRIN